MPLGLGQGPTLAAANAEERPSFFAQNFVATVGPQSVLANIAARAKTTAAEADLDEFRTGICEDRSFADDFRDAG